MHVFGVCVQTLLKDVYISELVPDIKDVLTGLEGNHHKSDRSRVTRP